MSTDHSDDWKLVKSQDCIGFQLSVLRSKKILFISGRTIWRYCNCAQTLPLPYIKCGWSPSLCNTINYRLQSRSCGEGTEGHRGLRVQRSRQSWPFRKARFLSAGAPHARTAALPPVSRGKRARIHRGRMEPPGRRAGGRGRARAPDAAVRPLPSAAGATRLCPAGARTQKWKPVEGKEMRRAERGGSAALQRGGRCARRRWGPAAPRPRPR